MVQEVDKEELRVWRLLSHYESHADGYQDSFRELSKLTAEYLRKNKPMPESLQGWLINVFDAMANDESPDQAFEYKLRKKKRITTELKKRNFDIYFEIRDLMDKKISRNDAISQLAAKNFKGKKTITNIYEGIHKHILSAQKSRPHD